jgi:hypothetical protein
MLNNSYSYGFMHHPLYASYESIEITGFKINFSELITNQEANCSHISNFNIDVASYILNKNHDMYMKNRLLKRIIGNSILQ